MTTSEQKKFLKALGQKINKIRKEKKLSFRELAYRADMEKANLVKLTTQGSNITMTTLCKIAEGLEVSLKDLL